MIGNKNMHKNQNYSDSTRDYSETKICIKIKITVVHASNQFHNKLQCKSQSKSKFREMT